MNSDWAQLKYKAMRIQQIPSLDKCIFYWERKLNKWTNKQQTIKIENGKCSAKNYNKNVEKRNHLITLEKKNFSKEVMHKLRSEEQERISFEKNGGRGLLR